MAQVGMRSGSEQREPADVVMTGGAIRTMNEAQPQVEAVAIRGGRIVAAGSRANVEGLQGPGTESVDLDGRTLLPGFIDPHMHTNMVQFADWTDVSPMATPTTDAVCEALRQASATSTGWVLARQFDPTITAGEPQLDRALLDRLVPDRPLLVMEGNTHVAYVNSAALAAAGVDRGTPDPPAGRYVRDGNGELTGRLEEAPAFMAFGAGMPIVTGEALAARIRDLLWHAASQGATMLHDCGIGSMAGPADLEGLQLACDADSPVRCRGMLVSSDYDTWVQMGLRPGFGDVRGDGLFRIDGMKAWSDGSSQTRTAFQRDPYLGTDSRGALNYSAGELADTVQRAHRDGWQVGVHANGDAAIDVTLAAYTAALQADPKPDHRHRIEHCSVLRPEQIEAMVALGLSPSFLIGHIRWWGRAFQRRIIGPERMRFYDPCASALRAGLRISLHSDWRVTPLEPLRYVEDAVTRIMVENGEMLNVDEQIGVEAALRAVTIDAAWQCRADDLTGSIEVGKSADLVILEQDPLTVEPTELSSIAISQTRLAGALKFSAP
ncbi:MAG: amidohydrolase [Ornithinimicrobium sp.]